MERQEFPEFDRPWRTVDWGGRDQMETFLRHFQISNPEVSHLRILLHGPTGAGVSSFVNSVGSVFQHRITVRAPAAPKSMPPCTKRFKSYGIRSCDGGRLPFILSDVMGSQDGDKSGIHPDDVINTLMGHVQENYVFNPISPLTAEDPHYISNPALNDKAHCLVSVLSATHVCLLNNSIARSLRSIRFRASELDVPHMVVLTHVDEACPLVRKDLRAIYESRHVKEKMQCCSDILGIPLNQIFPVKNYHEELDTNNDMDALILQAMKQIINCATDYMNDLRQ
ncbi:hypothetical protein PHYPO_G00150150 [Pangasianodon hypophthalmus]|uniref:G domain-containing protein n=2 Tax=Pangasianodon hypophthalmus TaxID=310915 RepID=A0A5N5JYX4_PANHP|nr:interferon-induced protein 44 isoform X1 [Pangasianodon hypophthalmus]XP_026784949.1 interferon-induced protein 44 isoform X1 [Pangasianodon hypophthalmus]KAB5523234.1 hypothetical protein PHYPO_G00150150 [Pangasianodon hypophthalmus]